MELKEFEITFRKNRHFTKRLELFQNYSNSSGHLKQVGLHDRNKSLFNLLFSLDSFNELLPEISFSEVGESGPSFLLYFKPKTQTNLSSSSKILITSDPSSLWSSSQERELVGFYSDPRESEVNRYLLGRKFKFISSSSVIVPDNYDSKIIQNKEDDQLKTTLGDSLRQTSSNSYHTN